MDDDLHGSSSGEEGSETDSISEEEEQSWISWYCSIRGNEFFCEVDEDYIHDEFNLTGLSQEVPYFDYALDTILDVDTPKAELLTEEQQETIDAAAELLYGLIHARFILTSKGLNAMFDKFQDVDFGRCSRVFCEGQPLLPCGQSDIPRKFTVTLYCSRCNDIYYPKSSRHANIDGAYYGTTFPHLFLMTFPQCIPPAPAVVYVPRVFGFRVRREVAEDTAVSVVAGDGSASSKLGSTSLVPSGMHGIKSVRAVGPSGPPESIAVAADSSKRKRQTRMGRTDEFATVLGPEALAARRKAGDDGLLEDEEDEEEAVAIPNGDPAEVAAASSHTKAHKDLDVISHRLDNVALGVKS